MAQARPRTAPTRPHDSVDPATSSSNSFIPPQHATLHPPDEEASFTFVCLGVGGGPLEGDCSCYLLKPANREWSEGAIVVEGGSWLGALTRVLENVGPDSAFAEVQFPHNSPALRAGFLGSFAHSFLISHAHLDHILGMVLGSASLPGKRKVFGLKPTLENLLDVFNGKIWPKLASFDDDGGPAVYLLKAMENQIDTKVDEAFTILPFALSHGLNPSVPPAPPTPTPAFSINQNHFSKRYSLPLNGYFPNISPVSPVDRASTASERPIFTSPFAPERSLANSMERFRIEEGVASSSDSYKPPITPKSPSRSSKGSARTSRRPKTAQGSEHVLEDSDSGTPLQRQGSTSPRKIAGSGTKAPPKRVSIDHSPPALDSTAFFITNNKTGKDVLFFGDVEPDCVSQSPRNKKVWAHAARRFAEGNLNTVFLECSFPAAHPTEFLYGHLSVKYLFDELRNFSKLVLAERKRQRLRRQKQQQASSPISTLMPFASSQNQQESSNSYTRLTPSQLPSIPASPLTAASNLSDKDLRNSLKGLSVVIVHVKMALFPSYCATTNSEGPQSPGTANTTTENEEETPSLAMFNERLIDPRTMQERILEELTEVENESKLGVQFVMAKQGMRIEC